MTHTENPLSADDVFQEENSEDNVVDDARLDDDYIEDDIIQARDNGVAKRRTGPLARLANWIGLSAPSEQKLQALSQSIRHDPEAPSAYVLRGELYLKQKQYHLAKADFERAISLTDDLIHSARWGLVAQTMRDRALLGLANKHIVRIDGDR
ncbi:MAG: hypothetical protein CL607_25370 [Anaerolineaceae bacterium]|nr:hypothetical protein [Anaerolineaceae bacterium]